MALMEQFDNYKIKECNIYTSGYANLTFTVDGMEIQVTVKEVEENA